MQTEVDYLHQWHRECEALYREHRNSKALRCTWQDFARNHPVVKIPLETRRSTDLTVAQLREVRNYLMGIAVGARILAVDLGILDIFAGQQRRRMPPSLYGAEPDPFEMNGQADGGGLAPE